MDTPGFVSAQTLHGILKDDGNAVGLATVYRTLASLAKSGDADTLQSPEGEALYRACETESHHHHLICRSCGKTVELEAADVEAWARSAAAKHGFREAEHVIDIFGTCADCAGALPQEAKA